MDGRQEVMLGFAEVAADEGGHFFYVRIPGDIRPKERRERFDDRLEEALAAHDLGEVTGGGSQIGEGGGIEFCGIDVVVTDREKGLPLIIETLRVLEAPKGTVVEQYLPQRIDFHVDTYRGT
ncbi:MAG: hypothetical protein ABI333_11715 [bacterium]